MHGTQSARVAQPGHLGGRVSLPPPRERFAREEVLTAALFLAPALILLGIFVIYPVFAAGYISLTDWHGFNPERPFVGLANYVRLIGDPEVWNSLLVTCLYAGGVCILSVVTGIAVALLLDAPIRGLSIYRSIYFLPAITSSVAAAIVWRYMLDPAGFLNAMLAHLGIAGPDWLNDRWLALLALTLLTVWKNIGFNAILYLTAMQALPAQVFEAATIDGANARDKIRFITVPLLRPMTFFVVVQGLITSFQSFDLVYMLTGGGPSGGTEVIGMLMYRNAFRLGDYSYGTAIAFLSLALVLGVTLVQWRASGAGSSFVR